MARRRSYRDRHEMRLRGAERLLFIFGATLYVIGLFGGMKMMDMPSSTAILLLAIGGAMLLITTLALLF